MIGEAGYETSEESSDFKDVREMRADKTQTWLSAGFGDDSPHEFVGTIMPASRAAEGKCATGSPTPGEPFTLPSTRTGRRYSLASEAAKGR